MRVHWVRTAKCSLSHPPSRHAESVTRPANVTLLCGRTRITKTSWLRHSRWIFDFTRHLTYRNRIHARGLSPACARETQRYDGLRAKKWKRAMRLRESVTCPDR